MLRKISIVTLVVILSLVFAVPAFADGNSEDAPPHNKVMVYVTSQDLVYESIVLGDLPFNDQDNFQKLEMTGPTGLQTEFGPGDTGYYGGRWWVDANMNGEMDADDTFFLCPLLGKGSATSP